MTENSKGLIQAMLVCEACLSPIGGLYSRKPANRRWPFPGSRQAVGSFVNTSSSDSEAPTQRTEGGDYWGGANKKQDHKVYRE